MSTPGVRRIDADRSPTESATAVECLDRVHEEPDRVVVAAVQRQPRERPRIRSRPRGQEARLPPARLTTNERESPGRTVHQAVHQRRARHQRARDRAMHLGTNQRDAGRLSHRHSNTVLAERSYRASLQLSGITQGDGAAG